VTATDRTAATKPTAATASATASSPTRSADLEAYGSLLVCVVSWGLVFPGAAQLLVRIDAVQVVTLRFMLVSLLLLVTFAARPALVPRLRPREWALVLVCGVLAVPGSQLAVVSAQNYLSAPLASLLPTFAPAIACVCAALFLGEHLGRAQTGGFALALAGVVLILVVGAGSGVSLHASSPLGAATGLITPLSWALYTIAVRPLFRRASAFGLFGVVYMIGTLTLAPAFPDALGALGRLHTSDWVWLGVMSTVGTVVPSCLWLVGLRRLSVSRTTAFMYLVPVAATLWTLAVTGKPPEAVALPGGLLVIAGVALTQRGRRPSPDSALPPPEPT
jgi:drug/metabolite transporter (DMT)-like permease